MTLHLNGREKALEAFGWTGRKAEWIALVCLHSGVFTRAQCARFLDAHPEQVRRGINDLIARGVASEESEPGLSGVGRVCRIFARPIYRALGAEHIRHRRGASTEVLVRRLLSLDHVIDHTGLPWLPTETEKVAAFEALGIERSLLPVRVYRGSAGNTKRYFPVKLPVALDAERALFVYADPGHRTPTGLRSWGGAHQRLWRALAERGRTVEIVVAARTHRETERAERVMHGWAEATGPDEPDRAVRAEIARIKQAILRGAVEILDEYGGLQGAMQHSVALAKRLRRRPGPGSIHRFGTWRTTRLAGMSYR